LFCILQHDEQAHRRLADLDGLLDMADFLFNLHDLARAVLRSRSAGLRLTLR